MLTGVQVVCTGGFLLGCHPFGLTLADFSGSPQVDRFDSDPWYGVLYQNVLHTLSTYDAITQATLAHVRFFAYLNLMT